MVHQTILEQLNRNVLPYVFRIHGLDIPYPAELWVNGNIKFQNGVVSFHIGKNGYLVGEYFAYDAEYIQDMIVPPFGASDCRLVISGTKIEIPVRHIRSSGKARTLYTRVSVPNVVVYECEIATWMSTPEDEVNSASIYMTGLPKIYMSQPIETDGWKIELKQPDSGVASDSELLSIVTLSKSDGSRFRLNDDTDSILSALSMFLSFQAGVWVNRSLIVSVSEDGHSERAFVGRLSERSADNNNEPTATDEHKWPRMFKTFWRLWKRPHPRGRLSNAIAHYIVCNAIFRDSQAAIYATVPAMSTLEALTKWWTGKDDAFEFGGDNENRFANLLLAAIHRAELGKDVERTLDTREVKKVIEKGTPDRNTITHGALGDIEDEEMSHVLPRSLYLHNLARLLISAKLGIRDSDSRGTFYSPRFVNASEE